VARLLLGDAVIVKDLPSAIELWQSTSHAGTLVTLDGEVLDPYGVVTGGPLEGEGHGALQRRREVQELEDTVRQFEAEFALAQERHRNLQMRVLQLEVALKNLDRDGRDKDLAVLEQEKDLARVGEELERLAARVGQSRRSGPPSRGPPASARTPRPVPPPRPAVTRRGTHPRCRPRLTQ
jgi:chromosome segregation protein